MTEQPLYILAGTYQQAQHFARSNGVASWRYVGTYTDLYGVRGAEYVCVGTWSERRDRLHIEAEIGVREFVDVTDRYL